MVKELLGGHVHIVDALFERLSALQAGDMNSPRVVVLRGASGTGKSRIIQELYERLRAGSAYWPVLPAARDYGDPLTDRKWISPPVEKNFIWSSGVLPEFGWWGFNCERLGRGTLQNVVEVARSQLDAHSLPLMLACQQKTSLADKVTAGSAAVRAEMMEESREIFFEKSQDTVVDLLKEVTGTALPFAETLIRWGVKGFAASHRRTREREALQAEVDQSQTENETLESEGYDLASVISSLAHKDLPSVVAIEDMHLMGCDLRAMVEDLTAPSGQPVLVIGTAWPEGQANPSNRVYRTWLQSHEDQGTVEVMEIPLLGSEELEKILFGYAPATTKEDARYIVNEISNPLLLKTWLDSPKTRLHINTSIAGAIELTRGVEIPQDIDRVIAGRWEELGSHLQWALVYAKLANPIGDAVGRFVPNVITEVVKSFITEFPGIVNEQASRIAEGLGEAVDPAAWCRTEKETQFFAEPRLATHAREQGEDRFGAEGRELILQLTFNCLVEWINQNSEGYFLERNLVSEVVSSWLLSLIGKNDNTFPLNGEDSILISSSTKAQVAAHYCLNISAISGADYGAAISHASKAVGLLKKIGQERTPDALAIRGNLAFWVRMDAQVDEVIEESSTLVADCVRILGADHSSTLVARRHLAYLVGKAGRMEESLKQLAVVAEGYTRIFGPDHSDTLALRKSFANMLGRAGQREAAAEEYATLADGYTRTLGPNHSSTLIARRHLAYLVKKAGRVEEATEQLAMVVEDCIRILGPNHPHTLIARMGLTYWQRKGLTYWRRKYGEQ